MSIIKFYKFLCPIDDHNVPKYVNKLQNLKLYLTGWNDVFILCER
jgi:hypothetical protein